MQSTGVSLSTPLIYILAFPQRPVYSLLKFYIFTFPLPTPTTKLSTRTGRLNSPEGGSSNEVNGAQIDKGAGCYAIKSTRKI